MVGTLDWIPALTRAELLAEPVAVALAGLGAAADEVLVAEIDPALADTATFCASYSVPVDMSANCVVIAARRGDARDLAACVVLATTRADVNGLVRRYLGARKASFAPMDVAVAETGMDHGGITPIGLPDGWPVLVDGAVARGDRVVVGSGRRDAKLLVPGPLLAGLPGAEVLDGLGLPPAG
jgi:prolyl-tRNA editing enzyme YbaK/EbsC (Cys-tRNA(Pro) deacylase)